MDVTPLLITKGTAKLALYGMSSIKDERLHRHGCQMAIAKFLDCMHLALRA